MNFDVDRRILTHIAKRLKDSLPGFVRTRMKDGWLNMADYTSQKGPSVYFSYKYKIDIPQMSGWAMTSGNIAILNETVIVDVYEDTPEKWQPNYNDLVGWADEVDRLEVDISNPNFMDELIKGFEHVVKIIYNKEPMELEP